MMVLRRKPAVMFKSKNGLLWEPRYLGYRAFLKFVRQLPACDVQSSRWWFGDWYINFTYQGTGFRVDTPLSDATLQYPSNVDAAVVQAFERTLREQLGVEIRPGPPPVSRKQWHL